MSDQTEFDYVIVGSGAGGGPLAANLARAGFSVVVLEAGGDPMTAGRYYDLRKPADGVPRDDEKVHAYNYEVPALHAHATVDPTFQWNFFVKHYTDPARQVLDSKYEKDHGGIWYPRVGALGGCTSHNAMITIYPHNSDWDKLAAKLGDPSWDSGEMRAYFNRMLEWLGSSTADPLLAVGDQELLRILAGAAIETLLADVPDPIGLVAKLLDRLRAKVDKIDPKIQALFHWIDGVLDLARKAAGLHLLGKDLLIDQLKAPLMSLFQWFNHRLNPNEMWSDSTHDEGLYTVPLAVVDGKRSGARQRLLSTLRDPGFGSNLEVRTRTLVTRVLFEGNVAVGVEYHDTHDQKNPSLYQADPLAPPDPEPGPALTVHARREVILAGGTYNTPQLLMFSGIGPKAQLDEFGIDCLVPLEGVGTNLHDRYEVGVVSEVPRDFAILKGAKFVAPQPGHEADDPAFVQWQEGKGLYTTNGAVLCVIRKSAQARTANEDPDLFIFGLPGYFKGYFLAYADLIEADHTHFTWAILKAHTKNRAGTVTLTSAKPWVRPEINFRYFDEGSPGAEADLQAVADGVAFALKMIEQAGNDVAVTFVQKGLHTAVDINNPESIKTYIKNEAWGHHACGTCRMGPKSADDPITPLPPGQPVRPDDPEGAVLDSKFRVRGTKNLRVVDASVFPDIPGFFIVAAVYMVSEKASDKIKEDADHALARNTAARVAKPA